MESISKYLPETSQTTKKSTHVDDVQKSINQKPIRNFDDIMIALSKQI